MADDIRRRLACDRCHSQKLRCPRRPGEEACDRCSRARTSCVFSPFRQKKLPPNDALGSPPVDSRTTVYNSRQTRALSGEHGTKSGKRKRTASQLQENDLNSDPPLGRPSFENEHTLNDPMLVSWDPEGFNNDYLFEDFELANNSSHSPLDIDAAMLEVPQWAVSKENGFFLSRREVSPIPQPEPNVHLTEPSSNYVKSPQRLPPTGREVSPLMQSSPIEPPGTNSPGDLIRRLSQLNIDLYENAKFMPPQSVHDPVTTEASQPPPAPVDYTKYSLEGLLCLTQSLIEIYPVFMSVFFGRSLPSSLAESAADSMDWLGGYNIYAFVEHDSREDSLRHPQPASQKPPPDMSSVLLILSSHIRLITIWEQLMRHMKVCIRQKGIAVTPAQKSVQVSPPLLQVGSFTPHPISATPMYAVMFAQFAMKLSNYASDLATEIQSIETCELLPGNSEAEKGAIALSLATVQDVKARANVILHQLKDLTVSVMGACTPIIS